ncbi:MAG: DUF4113 domain-containing protein [Bacteroidota bacterium]
MSLLSITFDAPPTNELIPWALAAVRVLHQKGVAYKKAGVLAHDLVPDHCLQTNLFVPETKSLRSKKLMAALDNINAKMGKDTVHFAASGTKKSVPHAHWRMNQQKKSKRYTTNLEELLEARAD